MGSPPVSRTMAYHTSPARRHLRSSEEIFSKFEISSYLVEPAGTWRYRLRTIDMDAGSIDMRKIVLPRACVPSQRRFYESLAKYSGFSGAVGSGKTHAFGLPGAPRGGG